MDLSKYKNVTSMTPNFPDTQKSVGFFINSDEDFKRAGSLLLNSTNAKSVLVTCGDSGMVVFKNDGSMTKIPVFNKAEVFDVTGAGDTVTAIYTLALCLGVDSVVAAYVGNLAASLVIKQFGCATTTIDELLNALEGIDYEKIQLG